ncbi:hypothetical protein [Dactylosporangium darangshiense]|uniref:hypothetical protein n=1 Tax=Dactylosporangium darangshiense TaxID=579108 RepID=UPI00363A2742
MDGLRLRRDRLAVLRCRLTVGRGGCPVGGLRRRRVAGLGGRLLAERRGRVAGGGGWAGGGGYAPAAAFGSG